MTLTDYNFRKRETMTFGDLRQYCSAIADPAKRAPTSPVAKARPDAELIAAFLRKAAMGGYVPQTVR